MSIRDRMSSTLNRIANNTARVNRALETTDRISENANPASAYERTASAAGRASDEVENMNRNQERAANGAKQVKNEWSKVKSAVQSAVAALGIQKILALADAITTTRARLELMNDGLQTTVQLQDQIMKSANRARALYQTTADAVSKMGIMAGSAFSSNKELIAFTELINKQFTIAGTSAAGIDAAMLQLTQAMSSGVLRGEELNSIFEQAPTIIQTIADYLNVPIGKIRSMAAEGQITSVIVKNAMLSAADEINAKFESMPMTFAQVWNIAKNIALETLYPVIIAIGQGAQYIYENWSTIAPVFWGVVAAAGTYLVISQAQAMWTAVNTVGTVAYNVALMAKSIVMGLVAIATGNAALAQQALNTAMLASPIGWILLAIGILIMVIYKWVQSVGGIKVAWLICVDKLQTGMDWVKIGFMTGVYFVMNLFNKLQLCFATVSTNIQNFMGDMKAGVLSILQNMVNGAIDIINGFINTLNKIPGVNIGLIEQVTFGTTAQLENEAAKSARASDLAAYQKKIESQIAKRDSTLNTMKAEAKAATAARQAEISAAKVEAANKKSDSASGMDIGNVDSVGSVGSIDSDINIAEEDLKFLRYVAEMRYVQNFVTLTPTVAVDAKISEKVDVDEVVKKIETKLEDEFVSAAEGVYN